MIYILRADEIYRVLQKHFVTTKKFKIIFLIMNRTIPALYTLTVNITNKQKYSLNTNKVHLFIHIHSHTNTYLNPNRQSAEKFASFANHVLRHEKREGKTILLTPLDTTPARKSLTTGHTFHIHCRVDTTKQFIFIYIEHI